MSFQYQVLSQSKRSNFTNNLDSCFRQTGRYLSGFMNSCYVVDLVICGGWNIRGKYVGHFSVVSAGVCVGRNLSYVIVRKSESERGIWALSLHLDKIPVRDSAHLHSVWSKSPCDSYSLIFFVLILLSSLFLQQRYLL